MSKRNIILLAAVWTAALVLLGFSTLRPDGAADRQQRASAPSEPTTAEKPEPAGEQTSKEKTTRSEGEPGAAVVSGSGDSEPGEATLKLGGEPGVSFSGRCVVDGEERQISGETPETFTFEPEKKLECEISSRGGPLRVTFSSDGTNTAQSVGPGPSTLELTYTGDNVSSVTRSGSQTSVSQNGSSQVSSSQSVTQSSSSQSISQKSSSSVTQSGGE